MFVAVLGAGCGGPQIVHPDGRGLEGQLEREVVAAKQRVHQLEQDLATCGEGSPPRIYGELHQVFTDTAVEVGQDGAVTVVTLPVAYVFSSQYDLRFREEAIMTLDLLGTALDLHEELHVTVVGHTDDRPIPHAQRGRYPDALTLTWIWARAVRDVLVRDFDVEPDRVALGAHASFTPIATNDTTQGQMQNRRVEVRLATGRSR